MPFLSLASSQNESQMGTFEKIFNRRVRLARDRLNLTQEQLGKRASMPAAMISHYECSQVPSPENLVRLADALEVTTDWLLGRTHEMLEPR